MIAMYRLQKWISHSNGSKDGEAEKKYYTRESIESFVLVIWPGEELSFIKDSYDFVDVTNLNELTRH